VTASSTAIATDHGATSSRRPERARAYANARRHSVFVRLLKIFIPLGALVASALIILVIYNPLGRMGLTLGPVSISGTKVKMESPRLTGFKKDSRPYEVDAKAAYQDIRKPSVVELSEMTAKMVMDEAGSVARLVANTGLFDTQKEHLDLAGDIRITTDKGEQVLLKSAAIDFKTGGVTSTEPVKITSPTMQVEADSLQLTDSGKSIVFVGKVHVVLKDDGGQGRAPSPKLTQAEATTP
jgi:lipopolysaccharide export system protein LptC